MHCYVPKRISVLKKILQDFSVSLKVLDLFNKKQTYGDVITEEENAFEDLELYCIDDSDKLKAIFIF